MTITTPTPLQPRRSRCLSALVGGMMVLLFVVGGCASSNGGARGAGGSAALETTMLTSVDLVRMTDAMARSLVGSGIDFQGAADAGAGFIIVTDRVVNRTNHMMDGGEKELFLTKLRTLLNQKGVLRAEGVVFVARPDDLSVYSEPMGEGEAVNHQGPTHALTATFATLTNVDRQRRADTYECAYQLQELKTRAVVWEDAYTVEYAAARGKMW